MRIIILESNLEEIWGNCWKPEVFNNVQFQKIERWLLGNFSLSFCGIWLLGGLNPRYCGIGFDPAECQTFAECFYLHLISSYGVYFYATFILSEPSAIYQSRCFNRHILIKSIYFIIHLPSSCHWSPILWKEEWKQWIKKEKCRRIIVIRSSLKCSY